MERINIEDARIPPDIKYDFWEIDGHIFKQ